MVREKKESIKRTSPVIGKRFLSNKKKILRLKKNKWGRYEDKSTNIIFDPKSRAAYGMQLKDGGIAPLTNDAINICKRNSWNYDDTQIKNDYSSSDDSSDISSDISSDDTSEYTSDYTSDYESDDQSDYGSENESDYESGDQTGNESDYESDDQTSNKSDDQTDNDDQSDYGSGDDYSDDYSDDYESDSD